MSMKFLLPATAATGSIMLMASPQHTYAQASAVFRTALGNRELTGLSPDKLAAVPTRMKQPCRRSHAPSGRNVVSSVSSLTVWSAQSG